MFSKTIFCEIRSKIKVVLKMFIFVQIKMTRNIVPRCNKDASKHTLFHVLVRNKICAPKIFRKHIA